MTRAVTHLCPFVEERDLGTLFASWSGDSIVELHEFGAHLDSYDAQSLTHEDMTEGIIQWLVDHGAIDPDVVTSWRTAGLDVQVSA